MIQALLVALWAGICAVDDETTQMLRRPLMVAPMVGIIMGDLRTSLLIGSTLEVMWMGVGNVGAYAAPDMISGTAIGTALGIMSGGTATAVALAIPTSLLAQQLLVLYRSAMVAINPYADRIAESGDFSRVSHLQYIPMICLFLVRAIPTFIAIYAGAGAITKIVAALPKPIMTGLTVAGSIIPAVGIGLLMLMMVKKDNLWAFLIAGFALAVYLKLSILAITLISLPIAVLFDMASQKEESNQKATTESDSEEEEYDL
ncbi:PTS sugar transporter subunit IIC [Lactobacillus sp. ESL0677]|uniref:PTS mannose/fructose/sorbose/N-acetylgalactosamine transporter subunit IIC n=1 Tax=Lactobacillus sp. ESL0677 TaxID=2983208 RepID=UPI0023FA345A|nr:PTS sugar transporter subunit IIC [Lactobacillus sp. ESL0677]WEV37651.1 PTS sugar transporter subunit IIC [Lactobacillus sp. ESL0677]